MSRFIFITVTVNPLSLQPSLLFHCSKRLRSMSVRSRRITGCCRAPPASSSICLRGLSVTSWAASPSSSQRCLATSSLTSSSSSMLSGSLSLRWSRNYFTFSTNFKAIWLTRKYTYNMILNQGGVPAAGVPPGPDGWRHLLLPGGLLLHGGHHQPGDQDQETLPPGLLHDHRLLHRSPPWHLAQARRIRRRGKLFMELNLDICELDMLHPLSDVT